MTQPTNQCTIGIIGGHGQMGRLFADFFRNRGLTVFISDLHTGLSNRQLVQKSDIVIVSVPILKTVKVIEDILPYMSQKSALMDFTSIKEKPVNAMLKGNCEVLGMHPMFGSTNPIPGQTVIFTPTKKSGKWTKWLQEFFKKNKVKIVTMTPKDHDKMMSVAQVLIHSAEIGFVDALRRTKIPPEKLLQYTGKASELKVLLAARLLAQNADLYGNIQLQNQYAKTALLHLQKAVNKLVSILQKNDLRRFKEYFEENKRYLGKYARRAYDESSYMIDQFIGLRSSQKKYVLPRKPSQDDLAVLGPENTFSDLAAQKHDSHAKKYYAHDIDEVFELVANGKVKEGIVPIENKLHGTVRETLDNLFLKNIHIVKEINLPIHHALIAHHSAKKSDIKTIISHSQALHQCKKFLRKNFAKINLENAPSTVHALEKLTDKSIAVIAPAIAAQKNHLKILAENIEDNKDNSTTFILIRRGNAPGKKSAQKTSIAFHFDQDAPGSLFTVFKEFAAAKINLTKIESRPTGHRFGDYIFFLDFNGSLTAPNVEKVLKSIIKIVARLKILGSY
ncbi:prephenate dehydratase [Candidatus Peregrinibacteria bacterium]|nr:prephenate dehydratase [Candidatus Peregrinibacteria bacterium]